MLTYGSYLERNDTIVQTSIIITVIDTLVALISAFSIFTIAFNAELSFGGGPGLVFITIPFGVQSLPFGSLIVFAFFGLLFCAALTSAISLLEVVVASVCDFTSIKRKHAAEFVALFIFLLGIPSALSGGTNDFNDWFAQFFSLSFFDLMDVIGSNWLLPLGAVATMLFTGWKISESVKTTELLHINSTANDREVPLSFTIFNICVKFVAPFAIIVAFVYFTGIWQLFAS